MIDDTIFESIIDYTRKDLDPNVFNKVGDKYVIKPDIAYFICDIVRDIDANIVDVKDYFIKGSILSFQWLEETDVDLLIEAREMSEDERRAIQNRVDERYGDINIPGTEHPLQIYINSGQYDYINADGIYRFDTGWVKGPYNIRVDVKDYMDKFRKVVSSLDITTGELKRDIIDYNILDKLGPNEIEQLEQELNEKLQEINENIDNLILQYKHIKDMRHNAFDRQMTPQEIIKYGTKNSLPENVVFKMLERYHYMRMLSKLKEIAEDGIQHSEIDDIEEIIENED